MGAIIGVAEPTPDGEARFWVRWVPTVVGSVEDCLANLAMHGCGAVLPGMTTVVWGPTMERRSLVISHQGRFRSVYMCRVSPMVQFSI